MKKLISVIAIAATALSATAAFAETPNEEQRPFQILTEQHALIAKILIQDTTIDSQSGGPTANFTGITSVLLPQTTGVWADNFHGGRVEPPSGK